eukprot:767932-Hanusia_phi.AAC.2
MALGRYFLASQWVTSQIQIQIQNPGACGCAAGAEAGACAGACSGANADTNANAIAGPDHRQVQMLSFTIGEPNLAQGAATPTP